MKMLDLFSLILQFQYYDIYGFMSIISKKKSIFSIPTHELRKTKNL